METKLLRGEQEKDLQEKITGICFLLNGLTGETVL